MLFKDLSNKTTKDLKKLEEEKRAELFALRFQASIGNLEKPSRIKELRKLIARVLTILSNRKKDGENTNIEVNYNMQETIQKVEKDAKAFAKKKKAKIEELMKAEEDANKQLSNSMDESLIDNENNSFDENLLDKIAKESDLKLDAKPATKTTTKKVVDAKPATKTTTKKVVDAKPATKTTTKKVVDAKPATKTTTKKVVDAKPATKTTTKKVVDAKPATKTTTKKVAPKAPITQGEKNAAEK